ncbi:MAG TPA: hypothetical protein VGA73_00775 [Candidatus Binatia bacterium]
MKISLRRDCCDALLRHIPELKVVAPFTRVQGLLPPAATCVVEVTATEAKALVNTAQRHCPDCVGRIETAIRYPLR